MSSIVSAVQVVFVDLSILQACSEILVAVLSIVILITTAAASCAKAAKEY